jgi:nucleoside-diphosphate-sugar epimerase
MVKLIFGCGYLGRRVARRWRALGHQVFVVTRLPERATSFAEEGFDPIVADVTRPGTLSNFPAAETVLYAIGYDRAGGVSRHGVQVDGLKAVLDALPDATGRIHYISSTAVYGSAAGHSVDEGAPCRPDRESGRIILAAEEVLRAHPLGRRAVVLRLAGLYGPGRIPRMQDLVSGRPIPAAADAVVNLIHVDDAAEIVLAAETMAKPPVVYVVSDGHPVARRDFYRYLAEFLHRPPPAFVDPVPGQGEPPRGAGNKRVSNARMLHDLEVTLAYPTYREGLAATLADR